MEQNKEEFIGEIKQHILSQAGDNTPHNNTATRTWKRYRAVRWLTGGGTVAFVLKATAILSVSALLIGLISNFSFLQSGAIPTTGALTPQLFFDGVEMTPDYSIPMDTFSDGVLNAGETEEFSHTFASLVGDGNYELSWDSPEDQMIWMTDPTSLYYGYTFMTTDTDGNPITNITVMAGDTDTVVFRHALDQHFQALPEGEEGIPYQFTIHASQYVPAPNCYNDFVSGSGSSVYCDVIANDQYIGIGLTLTIEPAVAWAQVIDDGTGHPYIRANTAGAAPGESIELTYRLADGTAQRSGTAVLHLTVT